MHYNKAFRYAIDAPGGKTNLLILCVIQFIPILGPIALLGYAAEVMLELEDDPDMVRHPKFEIDRLITYFRRGVWAFLMNLAVNLPLLSILFGAMFLSLMVDPPRPGVIPTTYIAVVGICQIVSFLFAALSAPMLFHAELTAKFQPLSALGFALRFWRKMWWPAIKSSFVYSIYTGLLLLLGLLACFVGIYFAAALLQMAHSHIRAQLYREYLHRGGLPIQITPPEPYQERRRRNWDRDDNEDDYYDDPDDDREDDRRQDRKRELP